MAEAALALGVHKTTVSTAARNDSLDGVGLGRGAGQGVPVKIQDKIYRSQTDAAEILKLSQPYVSKLVKNGKAELVRPAQLCSKETRR